MSHQVILQPDGLLAVWSTVVDDWILYNATLSELLDHFAEQAADDIRQAMQPIIEKVLAGKPAYHQFTMSFDEAQARRAMHHGNAPWPPT